MTFIGPTRPWLYRSNDEDRAHARREEQERIEAWLSDPNIVADEKAAEAGQQAMRRAEAGYSTLTAFEDALYGNEKRAVRRDIGSSHKRLGMWKHVHTGGIEE